jgi:prophage regulatory protein
MTRGVFPKLAGLAEIAGLAGVSRQRAAQLAAHPDFPEPVQRLAMGPVWLEADAAMFLATPRQPGRRPKHGAGTAAGERPPRAPAATPRLQVTVPFRPPHAVTSKCGTCKPPASR